MKLAKLSNTKLCQNSNLENVYYRQPDGYSCGATCIKMVSLIYNTLSLDIDEFKSVCGTNPSTGTIETGIIAGLNKIHLPYQRTFDLILNREQDEIFLNSILKQKFVYIMRTLLYGIKHWILVYDQIELDYYLCLDPSAGIVNYHKDFILKAHELRQFDGFQILKTRKN